MKICTNNKTKSAAMYAYDALGRRIGKYDAAAMETTFYYYNDQWQILAAYDEYSSLQRYYVYGNYIDEVLVMNDGADDTYYAHDHLYSPAALLDDTGAVVERCEYDAYGKVQVLTSAFSPLTSSQYANAYTFTGRQLDILDNGNLHHMHYRHRDYSPQLGRFLQHDPLGIMPASSELNYFEPKMQYNDGTNLYSGYFAMHMKLDPSGTKLTDIVKTALKLALGVRASVCIACGGGTLGIQAMCGVAHGICGEDLDFEDCVCEAMEDNKAWGIACNACFFPVSVVADIEKLYGCDFKDNVQ